jgi:hypothetical protein
MRFWCILDGCLRAAQAGKRINLLEGPAASQSHVTSCGLPALAPPDLTGQQAAPEYLSGQIEGAG